MTFAEAIAKAFYMMPIDAQPWQVDAVRAALIEIGIDADVDVEQVIGLLEAAA